MVLPKFLLSLLLSIVSLSIAAQQTPQQMQQVVGRISTEQKAWQQSKVPAKHYYKDNYAYSYPMYQSAPYVYYSRLENSLPAVQKLKLNYGYTIPYMPVGNARTFNEWKKKYNSIYRNNEAFDAKLPVKTHQVY